MSKELKGYILGIISAFFWGTHAVIVRYLADSVPGLVIATFRLAIASLVISAVLKFTKTKIDIKVKDKKWFFITVLFGLCINFIAFHIGLEYTTASSAMLLENTSPLFVLMILAIFFREKITKTETLAVITTFLGILFVTIDNSGINNLDKSMMIGDILEIVAAITWAIFIIGMSKVFAQEKNARARLSNMLKIFSVTALLLSPSLFLQSYSITNQDILLLLLLGIFPTALAYFFWFEAAARISTIAVALIFNLSIVFTFINAHIFLDETLGPGMLIGALLIVFGITITKLEKKPDKEIKS